MELNEHLREMLKELGQAINESISGSEDVSKHIQRIRDEGYNLYVVLDATIGLNKQREGEEEQQPATTTELVVRDENKDVQFRINVNDLSLLRGLGIDPTRKVRSARRVEPLAHNSDE